MDTEVAALAGWVARGVVAVALLASALWKLGHPANFRAAAEAAVPAPAAPLLPALAALLPPLEVLTAVLLLTAGPVSRAAALTAVGMLTAFTLVVARAADPRAGCGCWRSPTPATPTIGTPFGTPSGTAGGGQAATPRAATLLTRNGILLAAAVAGAALPQTVTVTAALTLLPAAALLALLVLELPTIGAVVAAGRR